MRTKDAANWPKEREERLRVLWDQDGYTASQIAGILGEGLTRNSIIGKVRRMNLSRRPQRAGAGRPRLHQSNTDTETRRTFPPLHWLTPGKTEILRDAVWTALSGVVPVSLTELESGMCKWPVGEGKPFKFCGAATMGTGSYCAAHHRASVGPGTASERAAVAKADTLNQQEWERGEAARMRQFSTLKSAFHSPASNSSKGLLRPMPAVAE